MYMLQKTWKTATVQNQLKSSTFQNFLWMINSYLYALYLTQQTNADAEALLEQHWSKRHMPWSDKTDLSIMTKHNGQKKRSKMLEQTADW